MILAGDRPLYIVYWSQGKGVWGYDFFIYFFYTSVLFYQKGRKKLNIKFENHYNFISVYNNSGFSENNSGILIHNNNILPKFAHEFGEYLLRLEPEVMSVVLLHCHQAGDDGLQEFSERGLGET